MEAISTYIDRFSYKIALTARNMYLIAIIELAIYSFEKGDLAMTRPRPLPDFLQALNPLMAYISGALFLIAALAFYLNRYRAAALLTIANLIFWLLTSRHALNLWRDHINGFKSLCLLSGALLILTTLGHLQKYQKKAIWLNLLCLFVFFVDCGIAHFQYAKFVQSLIPEFIPFPFFLTYFTGATLILGGVGLLIPQTQKWAALLSGVQVLGWFLLLHLPRALSLDGDEWIGVGESLAISGICFMIYIQLQNKSTITVETIIRAPIEKVWTSWTEPKHLVNWNNAFEDWHTPFAENDVKAGGRLKLRMEAKDGSAGFDHEAIYDHVVENKRIVYTTSDGRRSTVLFTETSQGVKVSETFEPEGKTPIDDQLNFVQSILNRFKKYVEAQK